MTALKPCPMGCPASFAAIENVYGFQRVKCDCGWTGPKRKNSVRAIAAWNRRADAPELLAEIAAKDAEIARLRDALAHTADQALAHEIPAGYGPEDKGAWTKGYDAAIRHARRAALKGDTHE